MKDRVDKDKMLVILKLSEATAVYTQEAVNACFESCESANISQCWCD